MVFKHGELLRTYYYRLDDLELSTDGVWLNVNFSDFVDKNGLPPDRPIAVSNAVRSGGEVYEFHEMDIYFSDTANNKTLQFYKVNAFGTNHEIFIIVSTNAIWIHYDQNDFESSIDRLIVTGQLSNRDINPEDWLLQIYQAGPGDALTGALEITLVVRVH